MKRYLKLLADRIDLTEMLTLKFLKSSLPRLTAVNTSPIDSGPALSSTILKNHRHPEQPANGVMTSTEHAAMSPNFSVNNNNRLAFTAKGATSYTNLTQVDHQLNETRSRQINTRAGSARLGDIALPDKPKRPTNSWGLFVRDRYADHWRPGMKASELGVILAKEWKTADKASYLEKSRKLIDNYKKELTAYQESLTPEMKEHLEALKAQKAQYKVLRKFSQTNPPVMRRNAANYYMQTECAKIRDRLRDSDFTAVTDLFREYRNLSPEEKQKYIDMQEKDRIRFKTEFNAWYSTVTSDKKISSKIHQMAEKIKSRYEKLGYI